MASDGIYLFLGRWGVSLTRPVLESFVWSFVGLTAYLTRPFSRTAGGEFLLHAP